MIDDASAPMESGRQDLARHGHSFRLVVKTYVWHALSFPIQDFKKQPELKEPFADPQMLPENAGCFRSAVAVWCWAAESANYKWIPFGKGLGTLLRSLGAICICWGLPFGILLFLLSGCLCVVAKMSGLTVEFTKLIGLLVSLVLRVFGLAVLVYIGYFGVMKIRGKTPVGQQCIMRTFKFLMSMFKRKEGSK